MRLEETATAAHEALRSLRPFSQIASICKVVTPATGLLDQGMLPMYSMEALGSANGSRSKFEIMRIYLCRALLALGEYCPKSKDLLALVASECAPVCRRAIASLCFRSALLGQKLRSAKVPYRCIHKKVRYGMRDILRVNNILLTWEGRSQ